jgi:2-amino-4-hydroxy-6-hydroxymethyldihydropteridine diphosphokinase
VIAELEKRGISVLRSAHSYESLPAEGVTGGNFLNTVFECERTGEPEKFLGILHEVEIALGSRVNKEMQARTCDLDLLLWGNEIIDLPSLTIPHPGMLIRDFVLAPLCDLIPDEPLPVPKKAPRDLLADMTVRYIIRQIPE